MEIHPFKPFQNYVILLPVANGQTVPKTTTPKQSPVNFAEEFKQQCSGKFFDVKVDSSPFCINSVFSLSTLFNDGAFACECDTKGSTSKYCQEFGGQCPCKPNVIGRQCSRCRVGYYGFPNCKRKTKKICLSFSFVIVMHGFDGK